MWRGERVQVARAIPSNRTVGARRRMLPEEAATLIVSPRPRVLTGRLRAAGLDAIEVGTPAECSPAALAQTGAATMLVASAEGWQAHWGAFLSLREQHPLVFHGCSLAELRALSRSRVLPPPINDENATGWLLDLDGSVERVAIPGN
jgi:S-DNA-T family DNA segregation ATPase FtsK/SpoIIIE